MRLAMCLSLSIAAFAGTSAYAQAPQRSLADFQGRWTCAGRFEANGRPINAVLLMRWDASSATLVVHHDEAPSSFWSAKPVSLATAARKSSAGSSRSAAVPNCARPA